MRERVIIWKRSSKSPESMGLEGIIYVPGLHTAVFAYTIYILPPHTGFIE